MGDTNATLRPDALENIGDQNLDKYQTTDNGCRMIVFLEQQKLFALYTLFNVRRKCHRITWKLGKASKRLDYFLADRWMRTCCMSARAYPAGWTTMRLKNNGYFRKQVTDKPTSGSCWVVIGTRNQDKSDEWYQTRNHSTTYRRYLRLTNIL